MESFSVFRPRARLYDILLAVAVPSARAGLLEGRKFLEALVLPTRLQLHLFRLDRVGPGNGPPWSHRVPQQDPSPRGVPGHALSADEHDIVSMF
eukprot:SAG31_NODE_182_length_21094_cov_4.426721_8_plen_94_part_00